RVLPVPPGALYVSGHEGFLSGLGTAAVARPERLELRDDALAERVAGAREREGDVRGQALEVLGAVRSGRAELQRGAVGGSTPVPRERTPRPPLLLRRARERPRELGLVGSTTAPALDAA